MTVERRLTFGGVADLYDRSRPSYPASLVDDVLALAGGRPAVEVGAGTGKATVLFAVRGAEVVAIEPSAGMVAKLRANLAGADNVEIVEAEFERWESGGRRFGLLYSAQAFHWIDPDVRYQRARAVLDDGGVLALFWNRPRWEECDQRQAIDEAYRSAAPGFEPAGPMHPAVEDPDLLQSWLEEIDGTEEFGDPELRTYEWSADYSPHSYSQLLRTHSDHILLPDDQREALLTAVEQAIESTGGTLRLPYLTRLCLARAV